MYHHVGRIVAGLVEERIVLGVYAGLGKVLDGSDVLLVGVVLALARDLDAARREGRLLGVAGGRLLVRLRPPAVDLCGWRLRLVVVVVVVVCGEYHIVSLRAVVPSKTTHPVQLDQEARFAKGEGVVLSGRAFGWD